MKFSFFLLGLLLLVGCAAPQRATVEPDLAIGTASPVAINYRKHRYWGIYCRDVKTSVIRDGKGSLCTAVDHGPMEQLLCNLPSDEAMRQKYTDFQPKKGLTNALAFFQSKKRKGRLQRHPEEMCNVRTTGYLYAAKKMNDNDYHLCLISNPDTTAEDFRVMNVEMAGIRKDSPDAEILGHARADFIRVVGSDVSTKWHYFSPAIPIEVEGALFFDGKKIRKKMKPGNFQPVTAWEVHPVYHIELVQ